MKKGQFCSNCAGDCCTLQGKAPVGSWYQHHFRQCRVRTLEKHGGVVVSSATEHRCLKQLPNGDCSDYEHRPALCRSYYCHGKLWRFRVKVQEASVELLRDRLRAFCLDQLGKMFDRGGFDRFAQLLGQVKGPVKISFALEIPFEGVEKLRKRS